MRKKKLLSLIICMMLASVALMSSCSVFGGGSKAESNNHRSSEIISEEEATKIALARVPGAEESNVESFEMEQDDGHWIYHGTIVYKGVEYDFEIEACNGNILLWEMDKEN